MPDLPARVNRPARFEAERATILAAVPGLFSSVEHIGSTAVPGLLAKPTIDVLGVARDVDEVLRSLAPLAASGYDYRPGSFPDDARHLFFRKVRDGKRICHLHVLEPSSAEVEAYRLFREFLRANPDVAERYARLKRELADRFAERRQAYVEAKEREVDGLMVEARRWAVNRRASPRRTGPGR